ncbi:MAG: YbhB/YbcL family Raf kinase inhibitor-like protein [Janthinobacterium lividum]
MLEKLPAALGNALRDKRPGLKALVSAGDGIAAAATMLDVTSPAFGEGSPIPALYTADGAGLSPPLAWTGVPREAAGLVLVIEDADSPTPAPLVHAIVIDLAAEDGLLAEGALAGPAGAGQEHAMGRNSFLRAGYLPPDPPPGHGPHRYAFQLFALDVPVALEGTPGRSAVVELLRGHVLARGILIGTFERP